MSPVKRICVFEISVMTNFNCACPAIQRGQGSGFLSEGSAWLTACMSEQRRFWRVRGCAGSPKPSLLAYAIGPNSLDAVQLSYQINLERNGTTDKTCFQMYLNLIKSKGMFTDNFILSKCIPCITEENGRKPGMQQIISHTECALNFTIQWNEKNRSE